MDKLKQCVSCRYCRMGAFVKVSAIVVLGSITMIVMMFENGL